MFADILKRVQTWHDKNQDIAALPWLLFIIFTGMTIITGGRFLNSYNIKNMLSQMPELGLLSLAMMIPMVTAGINLSIISSANLSAVIMALFIKAIFPGGGIVAVLLTIIIGLTVAVLLGWINGLLVGYVEVPAVLATLGTMILFEGITLAITKGFVISSLPESFLVLGNSRILGIPVQMIIFIIVVYAATIMFNKRPFGVHLYFIGHSPIATKFAGINIHRVLVKTYITSGLLAGIAAVVMLARFNSANARQGSSLLLSTVLICMLGGTDPFGGFGKVSGLVLAMVIMQSVASGFNLLGIRSFAAVAIWGIMLIGVMGYRKWQHRVLEKKLKGIRQA